MINNSGTFSFVNKGVSVALGRDWFRVGALVAELISPGLGLP